ncbi:probable mediator of RNA polymerase II transcription subunit 26c isoform X2 [Vitis vinifera]|uniref:probable mediator of RNA polymerase II transcription subunit 26c isoform X2 n=1 Tax=Vitis vinifera TaxID=29760 RepID=UPI0008FF9CED|nr:probable mediator of RNA polymerase II transcription subunit 26c isoform X2 [Vitis vinifera]|eukprot:XP_019075189.1 PREDICTED: probable mediator of RNA polymerase II transcription subunit 26c isoform X2 [Vitis vinifera]
MDRDEFRLILRNSGVDVWEFINTAISVAYSDYGDELRHRRDGIVERMYMSSRCGSCNLRYQHSGLDKGCDEEKEDEKDDEKDKSPLTPQSINRSGSEDRYGGLLDEEEARILDIKEHLEAPDQPDDSIVDLLQTLADMDITFKALKETDIGRHVNRLRKHPSNDVRRLVKHLVRKWKDLVDEWVKSNPAGEFTSSALMEGDSPPQKIPRTGHHQVPDFGYSPNPQNGSSGSDKNNAEPEPKVKAIPRKEVPTRPAQSAPVSSSFPPPNKQRDTAIDPDKFASARKRLHENYQEAQNGLILSSKLWIHNVLLLVLELMVCVGLFVEAKKQRTIQVMDIHDIPKPKNTFFAKPKVGSQGRHR